MHLSVQQLTVFLKTTISYKLWDYLWRQGVCYDSAEPPGIDFKRTLCLYLLP
jgi:hypothetical protein